MNVERVEALARLLHASKAQELIVETEAFHIGLRKAPPASPGPSRPQARRDPGTVAATPLSEHRDHWITAPLVGIFRQGKARLRPGDEVESGQPVGAIESMKILNPLVSELKGAVMEVLVEDGQPVEFGQPLLQIRCPADGGEE